MSFPLGVEHHRTFQPVEQLAPFHNLRVALERIEKSPGEHRMTAAAAAVCHRLQPTGNQRCPAALLHDALDPFGLFLGGLELRRRGANQRARIARVRHHHDVTRADGPQHACQIIVGDPVGGVLLLCIDRQPETAFRDAVDHTVPGVIDQQIVVRLQGRAHLRQRAENVAAGRIGQLGHREPVIAFSSRLTASASLRADLSFCRCL